MTQKMFQYFVLLSLARFIVNFQIKFIPISVWLCYTFLLSTELDVHTNSLPTFTFLAVA